MASDTLYELLGVPNDATTEEIRSAYRRLSKTYHPDRGGTSPFFRQLKDAHDTLTDTHLRAEYDGSLRFSNERPPPPPLHQEPGASRQSQSQNHSETSRDQSNKPSVYRRVFDAWSRAIDRFATKTGRRGRRRQQVVIVSWIVSVALAIYWIKLLVTHDLFFLIILVLGVIVWRRHRAKTSAANARQNAVREAAARAQAAKEAAARQRAERTAANERDRAAKDAAARERATKAERDQAAWEAASRERDEREAQETKAREETARAAAESGDLAFILALSPTQFEYTMAAMLRMLGMSDVQRVGGRGDLGVDITARDPSGRSMVVQCKRYARDKKIGSPDIQKFIGMAHVHHQADLKLFVTTSEYTEDARALARHHDIQLMNGADIENLARRQRESTRSE